MRLIFIADLNFGVPDITGSGWSKLRRNGMCKLNITVKDEYVYLNVKNKTIRHYVPKILERYTSVEQFDKENGVVTLNTKMNHLDGTTTEEEDWIDLNDSLAFAFQNPQSVIMEIDKIEIA